MTVALIAVAAGWALTILLLQRLVASERREHVRQQQLLVNQIMHLAGRTWQEPPSREPWQPEEEEQDLVDPDELPDWALAN